MAIKTVPRHDIPLNNTIRSEVMAVRLVVAKQFVVVLLHIY